MNILTNCCGAVGVAREAAGVSSGRGKDGRRRGEDGSCAVPQSCLQADERGPVVSPGDLGELAGAAGGKGNRVAVPGVVFASVDEGAWVPVSSSLRCRRRRTKS